MASQTRATEESRARYDELWRDLWANTHAGGPMARTRYRQALAWLGIEPGSRDRMLDVGAGNGAFMAEALKRAPGLDIYGAEFSQAAIALAHPSIRKRLAPCDLQGAEELPWNGDFQKLTCMEVLEHLPDDIVALRHIYSAMRPGGRMFISVPAWQALWGPQDVTAGHVRRYEPEVLRTRVENAGLRVLRMRCWGGLFCRTYLWAANLIGAERVMSVRPTGFAGLVAAAIYQILRIDDLLSFPHGPQLLLLAEKPERARV